MCLVVRELPDGKNLETIYRKQLDKSDQLKTAMTLYWQDISQRGEQTSYQKLKNMVRNHLERKRLDKNKDAWSKSSCMFDLRSYLCSAQAHVHKTVI